MAFWLAATMAMSGRQHETLLRTGNGEIDAPFVHAKIHTGERADAVDVQHGRVGGFVQRLAYC